MGILDKLFKKLNKESNNQKLDQKDSESQSQESYIDELEKSIQEMDESEKEKMIDKLASSESILMFEFKDDPLLMDAARLVVQQQQVSTSLIQRTLSIGYNRSGRIIDQLEMLGIVGPFEGSEARGVNFNNILDLEKYLKDNLPHKNKMKLFYEKYKDIIEQRRSEYIQRQEIENDRLEKEEIKRQILERERKKRLHKEVLQELIESGDIFNSYIKKNGKRESIPQDVMDKVWNRDGGRCVKCGSRENLEFDHIIPVSKGGATTYRNLQLLCKKCNLEKSNSIG